MLRNVRPRFIARQSDRCDHPRPPRIRCRIQYIQDWADGARGTLRPALDDQTELGNGVVGRYHGLLGIVFLGIILQVSPQTIFLYEERSRQAHQRFELRSVGR
jgi:hypothetical protein